MKVLFAALLCLPFLLFTQNSKKFRVLFIGNSYTYVNNLPQLVRDVAMANGDTLIFDSSTPGGYTFANHVNDAGTLAKISAGNWDFVVLQAQSQEPAFSPMQVTTQTLPYAIRLDTLVHYYNPCATTVYYETWGRKNGDAGNCANYPPICTYIGMQNRLRESYKLFADYGYNIMAPAGEAFRKSIANQPNLNLYQVDESHPSLEGSYLTASVFYEVLFRKSVVSNTYNPGLAANTQTFLQQTAHSVVNDSLLTWNIGKYVPNASFTYAPHVNPNAVQFQSSLNDLQHIWYFGDGSSSPAFNPVHSYPGAGTYTVSHVVKHRCVVDSITSVITVGPTVPTGIGSTSYVNKILLYPNPCVEEISISGFVNHGGAEIEIADVLGRVVFRSDFSEKINTRDLKHGIYFLTVLDQKIRYRSAFVKQ